MNYDKCTHRLMGAFFWLGLAWYDTGREYGLARYTKI